MQKKQHKECAVCGADISERHRSAKYCHPCRAEKYPEPKGLADKNCFDCGDMFSPKSWNQPRCKKCRDQLRAGESLGLDPKTASGKIVMFAVRSGILPKVDTLFCVDCGKRAEGYDHRDYMKPLDVDPVCTGCNYRRGPGLNGLRYCEERDREAVAVFGKVK